MRKLSLIALTSFLFLWGINMYIIRNDDLVMPKLSKTKKPLPKRAFASLENDNNETTESSNTDSEILKEGNIRNLDKIGDVINDSNVNIDQEVKIQIKKDTAKFDNEQNVKEKITMLEQSFLDKRSSVKDIKRLQSDIQDLKNKMKMEISNTEKWDPMFVYYLMITENYTYSEINQIRSLSENGISGEELNYINDLIKQESFKNQVIGYKNQGEVGRVVASLKKPAYKEKDEFIDSADDEPTAEDKLIEMNYGQIER